MGTLILTLTLTLILTLTLTPVFRFPMVLPSIETSTLVR